MGAPVPGDQVEGDLAKESEVARSRPVAHAAVILPEADVQHPMQRVLNTPVSADRPDQDGRGVAAAGEEGADLGLDLAGAVDAPDRLDCENRTQVSTRAKPGSWATLNARQAWLFPTLWRESLREGVGWTGGSALGLSLLNHLRSHGF